MWLVPFFCLCASHRSRADRLCARRSALHFVAAIGNLVCTKLLIDAGADLNLGDKDGAPVPSRVLASWLVQASAAASGPHLVTAAE